MKTEKNADQSDELHMQVSANQLQVPEYLHESSKSQNIETDEDVDPKALMVRKAHVPHHDQQAKKSGE